MHGGRVHPLPKDDPPGRYTTILKLMQIMAEKGPVKLIAEALAARPGSLEELANIRCMLDGIVANILQ